MIKQISTIIVLAAASHYAVAQTKEFKFAPGWKAGDKKIASTETQETEHKDGSLEEKGSSYSETTITVLKANPDHYVVEILYENTALEAAAEFYEKLGEELKTYKNLELKYRIDKQTGHADLINWKEAQAFMNKSFDQIDVLLKKKAPDMASYAKLALAPIKAMLKDKENIEAYMHDAIGFLLFPYDKKFIVGDTLKITEYGANPFNPMDTIAQNTLTYLGMIDESKRLCDIHAREIFDLSGFKEMMKGMMEKMSTAFGAADSSKTKAAKEIDSIEFDVTKHTVTTFNYGTSWPVKVVKTGKVIANAPGKKTEKLVITTIMIK